MISICHLQHINQHNWCHGVGINSYFVANSLFSRVKLKAGLDALTNVIGGGTGMGAHGGECELTFFVKEKK